MEITGGHKNRAARMAVGAFEGYLAAVERIADYSADRENPYYLAPHDEAQFVPGIGICVGPDGVDLPADEVEQWAYELLVLVDMKRAADLAEGESGT